MPSNDTASATEQIRREKTARRFYETQLADRAVQIAHLVANRRMLRRGAYKQQDGTLGQPGEPSVEEEPVNIRIGDDNHYGEPEKPATVATTGLPKTLLEKALPLLLAGGLGAGGALAYDKLTTPADISTTPTVDTDTRYILELVPDQEVRGVK